MADNAPLPVNNSTTFRTTGKNETGAEKQSHGGYVRTNSATKEAHFVAPKNFPGAVAPATSGEDNKKGGYKEMYVNYDLTNLPDDDIPYGNIRENFYGDINTHWLLRWEKDEIAEYSATQDYEDNLDDGDFYGIQNRLLGWRNIFQKTRAVLKNPKTEKAFVEAIFSLFLYQGCFNEDLRDLKVGDVKILDNAWHFNGRTIRMTKELFDYADKLMYLKDAMAPVFSFKYKNEPFHKIEMGEMDWFNIKMSKFRLLYGTLVQLHNADMLNGIKDESIALSYMISASAPAARFYHQSVEDYWDNIPFDAIKLYLMTGGEVGEEEPLLNEIEEFCEKVLGDILRFPIRLDVVLTPFETDFFETFFGKVTYDRVPEL